jgi:hypothetical protein
MTPLLDLPVRLMVRVESPPGRPSVADQTIPGQRALRAPTTAKGRGWCATRRGNDGTQHPRPAPGEARALRRGRSDQGSPVQRDAADNEGDAGDLGAGRLLAQDNQ